MRVVQLLPTLAYGDAVGNDTLSLGQAISDIGYDTMIYAEHISAGISPDVTKLVTEMPETTDVDVIIYHLSTGSDLNYQLADMKGRKIIVYHNITPPHFFQRYQKKAYENCKKGLEGASFLADKVDYVLADSDYNKQQLIEMGYTCRIDVLPILISFLDYKKKPQRKIMKDYANDGFTKIVFTGRIAPNKKQEDIIAAFGAYQKYYNPWSQLILVGNYQEFENYKRYLMDYKMTLNVKDVRFTGHTSFADVLAYYHMADLFLCMSEHEGFCVPLVESMFFDVPIVAYDSSAVGETLGGSGFLLKEKDPIETAAVMNRVLTDRGLRQKILDGQRQRLKDFSQEKVLALFQKYLTSFIEDKK